jgi:amidase
MVSYSIPISLKKLHSYASHVTHASFVSTLDSITPDFALTPQILYDLGAVFYIRTDQPQTLMQFDNCNNINFRRCKNAYNTSASPGGTFSGEGALLGMRGSPLGLGSGIGGSIRGPAAFNGAWGLKSTTKRLSLVGVLSAADDFYGDGITPVVGPMANSVDDLELFMKSYLSKEPGIWINNVSHYRGEMSRPLNHLN